MGRSSSLTIIRQTATSEQRQVTALRSLLNAPCSTVKHRHFVVDAASGEMSLSATVTTKVVGHNAEAQQRRMDIEVFELADHDRVPAGYRVVGLGSVDDVAVLDSTQLPRRPVVCAKA